ncbi:MAG: ferritin family protein [Rhodospirillales bacterium]|nr:ferritin family protein [Rhodospirillales bacterium]
MTDSLPEFLAHSLALEHEAAERYRELADIMENNLNPEVGAVFRDMARFSGRHHSEIKARAGAMVLPELKSWQYRWATPPEATDSLDIDFFMQPYNALRIARDNELRGYKYYRQIAREAADPEIKRLAEEFAQEERGHIAALDKWLALAHRPSETWEKDPEPLEVAD